MAWSNLDTALIDMPISLNTKLEMCNFMWTYLYHGKLSQITSDYETKATIAYEHLENWQPFVALICDLQ